MSNVAPYIVAYTETEYEVTHEDSGEWGRKDKEGELVGFGVVLGNSTYRRPDYRNERSFDEQDLGFMPNHGDEVFLVIERYADGDTFGSISGIHVPVKVFKTFVEADNWTHSDEAERLKNDGYFGGHEEWLVESCRVRK